MTCIIPELPSLKGGRKQLAWTRYLDARARHDERHARGLSSSASTPTMPTGETTPREVTQELARHEFACKPRPLLGTSGRSPAPGKKLSASDPSLRKTTESRRFGKTDSSFRRSAGIRSVSAGGWFGDVSIHSTRPRRGGGIASSTQQQSTSSTQHSTSSSTASRCDTPQQRPGKQQQPLTGLSLETTSGIELQDEVAVHREFEAHQPEIPKRLSNVSLSNALDDFLRKSPKAIPQNASEEGRTPNSWSALDSVLRKSSSSERTEDRTHNISEEPPPLPAKRSISEEALTLPLKKTSSDMLDVIAQVQDRAPTPSKNLRFASNLPSVAKPEVSGQVQQAAKRKSVVSRHNSTKSVKSEAEADDDSSSDDGISATKSMISDGSSSEDDTSSEGSAPEVSWKREPIECHLPAWYPDDITPERPDSEGGQAHLERPSIECIGSSKVVVRWKMHKQANCDMIWCICVRQVDDEEWHYVDLDSGRIEKRHSDLISWKHHALIAQPGVRVLSYAASTGEKSDQPFFGTIVAHYPGLVVIDFDPVVSELHMADWRQIVPQDWVVLAANKVTMGQIFSELLEKQKRHEHKRSKALWSNARANVFDSIVKARRHCSIVWNFWTPPDVYRGARLLASCAMKSEEGGETYSSWPVYLTNGEERIDARNLDWPTELCCSDNVDIELDPWPRIQIIPKRWMCDRLSEAKRASENCCLNQRALAYYNCSCTGAPVVSEHPDAIMENDITLQTPASKNLFVKSERAVFCTILRPFIAPQKVIVKIFSPSARQHYDVPLASIRRVQYGSRRKVSAWCIWQNPDNGTIVVKVRLDDDDWDKAKVLDVDAKVTLNKKLGPGGATTGVIKKITTRITHYEVVYTSGIPSRGKVSPHSLTSYIDASGCQCRLKEPEVVIHDIPEGFKNIEICVGVSRNSAKEQQHPVWSAPSLPCKVYQYFSKLQVPLGPYFSIIGISVVEATWLLPNEPLALCYRVRFRKAGDPEWSFVDSQGKFREKDSAFAWRTRLVPLKEGLWVSTMGLYDSRKASTPGPAKVVAVGMRGQRTDLVQVNFQKPANILCVGTAGSELLQCTQSPQLTDEPQGVSVEWIEAAWVRDSHTFWKGSIITSHCLKQPVNLTPLSDDAKKYRVKVQNDENVMHQIDVGEDYFQNAGSSIIRKGGEHFTTMQSASLHLHNMQPEGHYEVGVQALTTKGWTDWSHSDFHMPKTALKQEEIVIEKARGALYKSALLQQAFYKEYQKCWLTLEECLSPDRFSRLKAAMKNTFNSESSKLSRWLVDQDGPIRSSKRRELGEIRELLQDIVRRRADLNYRDQSTGRTPLTYACEYCLFTKPGVVDELLKLGADPDLTNDLHQSPLLLAAERADIRIVKSLLDFGADANLMSLSGVTPYIAAKVRDDMNAVQRSHCGTIREMLSADRVPWEVFLERINAVDGPDEKAYAFLELAFAGVAEKDIFVSEPDGSKRISSHDRLRLREQIAEAEEFSAEEAQRRAIFCGRELLLSQIEASTDAGGRKPCKACSTFTRYLLSSGVMRFVKDEAHLMATKVLDYYEIELREMRENLQILRTLTHHGEMYVGNAGKKDRKRFMGRVLHQWHAHDHLPWLIERNVVGAFEALVQSNAVQELVNFCHWVGDLSAQVHSLKRETRTYIGAWDPRLPALFWGDVYTRFLLGEASRTAPIFHELARSVVKQVGGSVTYKDAPNKNFARVSKKQIEYATFGMLVLHVALDHMYECFQQVLRVDLEESDEFITKVGHVEPKKGAILILGVLVPEERLQWVQNAVRDVVSNWGGQDTEGTIAPPILVVFPPHKECHADKVKEVKKELLECGAAAVLVPEFPLDDIMNIRRQMEMALREAYTNKGLPEPRITCVYTVEQLRILSDIRKVRTKHRLDLYTAGGVLDLVRGSIECTTEEEVQKVYEIALGLTVQEHGAEVVRVKNGFHTPAVGGYCDLKLFVQIAKDCGDSRICHICELQVHLQKFLARKKYTHMPYVIDRGDFDHG